MPPLGEALEEVKNKAMPMEKPLAALEEDEYEDMGEAGSLKREMLIQGMYRH